MTLQQIFNHVANHLLVQNKTSQQRRTGYCRYRGAGGTMCAVGCLIDDAYYTHDLEGRTAIHPDVLAAVRESIGSPLPKRADDLLMHLQHVHDVHSVADWPDMLRDTAKTYNLSTEGTPL